jgi:hypothetical protein
MYANNISASPLSRTSRRPTKRARTQQRGMRFVVFTPQCDRAKDFFIWIRHNPLKSPESAKGIQGNASLFPWIYLLLLAFIDA